jgi:predicted metalloendopeptidase
MYFDYYTLINKNSNTKHIIQSSSYSYTTTNNTSTTNSRPKSFKKIRNNTKNTRKKQHVLDSAFDIVIHKVNNQLRDLITKKNIPEFKQILKYKNLNEHEQMVNTILLEMGQIYTYTNVNQLITHFILHGHSLPFTISTDLNIYNPKQCVLTITDTTLSLYNNLYNNKKILHNYKCLLTNIFNIVFGPNHAWDITCIIYIEKKIASSYHQNEKNINNIITNLKLYSLQDIQKNGLDLYNILPRNLHDTVQVLATNIRGIKLMMTDISRNWNTIAYKTYWVYQLIITYSKCNPNIIKLLYEFGKENLNSDKKPTILYLSEWVPYKLNYYYYKYYKNTQAIKFCSKLTNQYINKLIYLITKNKWMTSTTKDICILKLAKIKCIIGYDSDWNTKLDQSNSTILQNIINANIQRYKNLIQELQTNIPFRNTSSFNVNAYYIPNQNIMYIPNGILQPPFVDLNKDMVYNIACLGTIIGHELSHSIDLRGLHYNENTIYNKNTWMTKNEVIQYKYLQKNIVKYLEYMCTIDKLKINCSFYISETTSDINGLLLSEEILLDYLKENNMPISENLHKFYTYYTQLWKNTKSIKKQSLSSFGDFHMFEKYRINCALISSNNFRNLYNIKKVYENIL